jgi:hypothetical protein
MHEGVYLPLSCGCDKLHKPAIRGAFLAAVEVFLHGATLMVVKGAAMVEVFRSDLLTRVPS